MNREAGGGLLKKKKDMRDFRVFFGGGGDFLEVFGRKRENQGELAWERKLAIRKLSRVPGESLSSLIRFFILVSGIISLLTHG